MNDKEPILEFTGERFTPECVREIAYEHWHRYAWALPWIKGQDVLDVASGEGYGSHLISQEAKSVVGVDIDVKTIEHAREKYNRDNLSFQVGDVLNLPVEDSRFDVVVCFETIEHLADHPRLMTELKRVLKPDGLLLMSSPDKSSYSDQTGYDNPFHVKELYREELDQLLATHFKAHRMWAQRLLFASTITPLPNNEPDGDSPSSVRWTMKDGEHIHQSAHPNLASQYYLAVASASGQGLDETNTTSMFTDKDESVYQHYIEEIQHHIRSAEHLAEKDQVIERLTRQLDEATAQVPWWHRVFGSQGRK